MYRYDWLENLFGLNVHTIDRIAPEYHDYRDFRPVLLREADFLDFLGIIGLVREYGRGPKDVESACRVVLKRRELIQDRFTLPIARQMAQTRLARLAQCLEWLQEESFDLCSFYGCHVPTAHPHHKRKRPLPSPSFFGKFGTEEGTAVTPRIS